MPSGAGRAAAVRATWSPRSSSSSASSARRIAYAPARRARWSRLRRCAASAAHRRRSRPGGGLEVRWTPSSPHRAMSRGVRDRGAGGARAVEGLARRRPLLFFPYAGGRPRSSASISRPGRARRPGAWLIDAAGARPGSLGRQACSEPARVPRAAADACRRRWWTSTPRPSAAAGRGGAPPRALRDLDAGAALARALRAAGGRRGPGSGLRLPPRSSTASRGMPHSGVDFSAGRGTPVVASNSGRVALVGDFFFAGRLVALDHGLGLYTLYFHLDRVGRHRGRDGGARPADRHGGLDRPRDRAASALGRQSSGRPASTPNPPSPPQANLSLRCERKGVDAICRAAKGRSCVRQRLRDPINSQALRGEGRVRGRFPRFQRDGQGQIPSMDGRGRRGTPSRPEDPTLTLPSPSKGEGALAEPHAPR